MVTYMELVDTRMNFCVFLATSLTAIVAIIALVVTNRIKK